MAARSPMRRRPSGFTLVEVLVALTIMAILAALAFRGIDALVRAKDSAQLSTDRTLKLNTGMSQFEYDISQVIDSKVLPQPIMFDGATLRIARRTPDGIQLVLWSLQDRRWQRWASGSFIHMAQLTELRLSGQLPAVGKTPFTCVQLGRNFKGTIKATPTPNPSFRRVDAIVANDDGRELLTISTVMTRSN